MRATTPESASVCRGRRYLLAHRRTKSGVEGEKELLDVLPVGVRRRARAEVERRCVQEDEDGGDAAVVKEAEAAHLIAEEAGAGIAADRREPEHADLLIEISLVGDLELLRLAFDRREAVGAERQAMAGGARQHPGVDRRVLEETRARRLL
jgi:hypothetical protein